MTYQIDYFHQRVLAEIESWPVDVLADYARLVELLAQHGPTLRLPHAKAFGAGLFELRPRGHSGIGRAFYCFLHRKRIIVVHAFIKKTQETPDKELKLARKRVKELQQND
ncbi:MAG: type II toxin-antitoxin system RelE/ParE family toxin [Pseudomonadales bacterium]|jgi:phage-related protein|nr:type II toxin-antitoxin system RelE/ParE family toxin [Pseudomonadales bacterium]